ncbi:MAG: NAD(P)/FAD-dependent oxidoreductase [Candidatus Puniceispirillaceae bacterium]
MHQTSASSVRDVIIIGSGISGLSAARTLKQSGREPLILDKGRRIGGRCSTKRKDGYCFNHGAQFFTTRDSDFHTLTIQAAERQSACLWSFGHHSPAYIGMPTMRDFASFLGRDFDHRQDVKVTNITKDNDLYHLTDEAGTHYSAHHVIITAPAPQAAILVADCDTHLSQTAQTAIYDPCWTVMLALEEEAYKKAPILPLPVRDDTIIGWANFEPSRLPDKATSPYLPAITIQANPAHSQKMLHWDKQDVIDTLAEAYFAAIGQEMVVKFALAHRWLYARVAKAADDDHPFINSDHTLALAGDYFGTARIESAYLSGRRAALALR